MWPPEWVDRPIVTLLIGLSITAVVVPFAARRWASKQKEQEVKTDLVSDIAITRMRVITRATMARESILAGDQQESSQPKDRAAVSELVKEELRKFGLKRQVIGTRLEAYFGAKGIPEWWDHLCDSVEQLCELWDISPRSQQLNELEQDIEHLWGTLKLTKARRTQAENDLKYDLRKENRKVDCDWRWARMRLLYCKASVIRLILQEPMPVYAWRFSRARHAYRKAEKKYVASTHGR